MTRTIDRRTLDSIRCRIAAAAGVVALTLPASARQAPIYEGDVLIPLGFGVSDLVQGDFDGNGWIDLIATSTPSVVRVMLATGRGVWAPPTSVALAAVPKRLLAADVNGDGRLDVVASHLEAGALSVLLGIGDGTFAAPTAMPVATASFTGDLQLAAADVDGDSDLDLLATTHDGLLRLVRNLGGGTFASAITVPLAGLSATSLATGDLDGDGDVDLALGAHSGTCNGGAIAMTWLNDGTGAFAGGAVIALPGCANVVRVVDLDGDLVLDLAACGLDTVTPSNNGYFRAWSNQGGGTFVAIPTSPAPTACDTSAMRFADLDADGDADAVVSLGTVFCSVKDNMFVCENQSGVQFGAPVYTHTSPRPQALTLADFDGDADVDIAAVGSGPTSVRVHFNSGDGSFAPHTYPASDTTGPTGATAADFDGDGYDDVAMIGGFFPVVTIRMAAGDGTLLAPQDVPSLQTAWAITGADVDGDSDLDLIVAGERGSMLPAPIRVLFNDGTGQFTASPIAPIVAVGLNCVAAGDIDGDGDLDAVVTHTNGLTALTNDGSGNFTVLSFTPINLIAWGVALADFNGDGTLDAAVGRYQGSHVSVQLNSGVGFFSSAGDIQVGLHVTSIVALDIDGDADIDVVSSRDPGGAINVLRNGGAANFAAAVHYQIQPGTDQYSGSSLSVLDVDSDGDLDLATAVERWSAACVLRNDGSGVFGDRLFVPGGFGMKAVTRARLDAGSSNDLVMYAPSTTTTARNSASSGEILCTGEAPAAACPCGNVSPAGSGAGCLNSFGTGGTLRTAGSASLSNDRLVLSASLLPPTTAILFFQGTVVIAGGPGSAFGDGLRCAGGSVRRLGTRVASASLASLPSLSDPRISATGLVLAPGTRVYQGWYRNAASFCTASTFNLTNAVRITWIP